MQLIKNTAGIDAYIAYYVLLKNMIMNYLVNNMSKQFIKSGHYFVIEINEKVC